jgi:sulfur relay (sulfurtransferase) complex TusBCD TusD component (DsrE family)
MMDERKLGILLSTSPESENTYTVIKIAEAALLAGKEVYIFLMDDGVYNVNHSNFCGLTDRGAQITLCGHNAEERNVLRKEGIDFGSQYDLAGIAHKVDRFLAFN